MPVFKVLVTRTEQYTHVVDKEAPTQAEAIEIVDTEVSEGEHDYGLEKGYDECYHVCTAMPHEFIRINTASSCESFIQPTCRCGWNGRPISNMHNLQMHEVSGQERQHTLDVQRDTSIFYEGDQQTSGS